MTGSAQAGRRPRLLDLCCGEGGTSVGEPMDDVVAMLGLDAPC